MTTRVRTEPRAPEFANRLGALPAQPGVYLMKSAGGGILYVGKAASLRNRVRSYFQTPYGKELRIQAMVRHIADFEFIVTESVQEALLLENLLIKQHKPFYNARLKDDKTYPYIKIDLAEEFPQVYFTRRVLADGARYFGPFASASSVRKTMDLLKKLFPYRSCTKTITGNDERPCLEYYIHRCVAPCIGVVDAGGYGEVIRQVLRFLEGDSESVEMELQRQHGARVRGTRVRARCGAARSAPRYRVRLAEPEGRLEPERGLGRHRARLRQGRGVGRTLPRAARQADRARPLRDGGRRGRG